MRHLVLFGCIMIIAACNSNKPAAIHFPEGGYSYIKTQTDDDSDFCWYPLKDSMSSKDSIKIAYWGYHFYKSFDEPNISLKPEKTTVFRLTYFDGSLSSMRPIIITLKPNEIIVKEGLKGNPDPYPDTSKLNRIEKQHFVLLERYFPFHDTTTNIWKRKYLDSIKKVHPQLTDPAYYRKLLEKSTIFGKDPFAYSTKRYLISTKTYIKLVTQINESGYWKLPYDNWCKSVPNDAAGFNLEANANGKFNIVRSVACYTDSSTFKKACQQLVNEAMFGKEIRLF